MTPDTFEGRAVSRPSLWARFRPVVILGLVIAVVTGTLLALAVLVLSVSDVRPVTRGLFKLAGWIAALAGIRIVTLAYRVDPGGWRGYLTRVAVSTACSFAIGAWANLCYWILAQLVALLPGVPEPTLAADHLVQMTLLLGYLIPAFLALVLSALYRKKKR